MKTIQNIDSSVFHTVTGTDDNIVTITFNSGNTYNYQDITGNFVDSVENAIENNQSVGSLFNRALKEDQTLQIITV